MKFLIINYYERSIKKYVEAIYNLDQSSFIQKDFITEQLLKKEDKKIQKMKSSLLKAEKEGSPLWVNRTLFLSTIENKPLFYNHWLSLGEEDSNQVDEKIDRDQFYLGWGNNLVIDRYDEKTLSSAIDALNICQYYNVILDNISNVADRTESTFSIKR